MIIKSSTALRNDYGMFPSWLTAEAEPYTSPKTARAIWSS